MIALSRGTIRKRTWRYCDKHGRAVTKQGSASSCAATECRSTKRAAYEFTLVIERDGAKKRIRRTYPTHAEAKEGLEQFKGETRNPKPEPAVVASITLAEAFERYFKAKARKRSLKEDERTAKHLKAELGEDTPLSELTAAKISEYKGRRLAIQKSRRGEPLSAASINRPLALLRCLLTMAAKEWEVLETVPTIRLEQEPEGKVVWLDQEAELALLEAAKASRNADLHPLVLLGVETGMRCGELLGLEWARIDLSRGVITLASRNTKSKRSRVIPMRQAVYDLLAARQDRQGYVFPRRTWDSYRTAFETIAAKVVTAPEGEPLTFHGLRHHFASWFMMRGGRLEVLSKILGHSTLQMTQRYAHLSPDYLRVEMAKTERAAAVHDASREQEVIDSTPSQVTA
jgi:integrase